jgi:hypothetical protein
MSASSSLAFTPNSLCLHFEILIHVVPPCRCAGRKDFEVAEEPREVLLLLEGCLVGVAGRVCPKDEVVAAVEKQRERAKPLEELRCIYLREKSSSGKLSRERIVLLAWTVGRIVIPGIRIFSTSPATRSMPLVLPAVSTSMNSKNAPPCQSRSLGKSRN